MKGKEKKQRGSPPQDQDEKTRDEATSNADSSEAQSWVQFQEKFPHLAKELEETSSPVQINGVRWEESDRTRMHAKPSRARFAGYSPDIIDFLRRCMTEEEALEIIEYMERQGKIDTNQAQALRQQLQRHGIRSFGSHKRWGHYERDG